MTESTTSIHQNNRRKVSSQERSVLVGDTIVINGFGASRIALKQRFAEGGYRIDETDHFLLFRRSEAPTTILVHFFSEEEMNADIKHYMMLELKPLSLITTSNQYGKVLAGIVSSYFPEDVRRAWHYFGANTLQRFVTFLSTVSTPPYPPYTNIGSFATQYQRICELCVGTTFLDAGCESGFLPLLIAERMPFMEQAVGVDIRSDMFTVVSELAEERGLKNVQFIQADLLADDFSTLGRFDTVVALGVLEHFSETDMYQLLTNLLNVTSQRLICMVPYEQELELIYEHKQLFTRKKLEAVGKWCLQQLGGTSRMWCEDCVGGLLLIERC